MKILIQTLRTSILAYKFKVKSGENSLSQFAQRKFGARARNLKCPATLSERIGAQRRYFTKLSSYVFNDAILQNHHYLYIFNNAL